MEKPVSFDKFLKNIICKEDPGTAQNCPNFKPKQRRKRGGEGVDMRTGEGPGTRGAPSLPPPSPLHFCAAALARQGRSTSSRHSSGMLPWKSLFSGQIPLASASGTTMATAQDWKRIGIS